MTAELPRTFKVVTVWLVVATALFLAVQAWLAHQGRARVETVAMGTIELRRALDGHFHWPGRVNGQAVEFLVDTGATRTALPGALARRLDLPGGRNVQSSTAGGVVRGFETVADVELAGGLQVQQLRMMVLPDLEAPLLGMDVLSRLKMTMDGSVLRLTP